MRMIFHHPLPVRAQAQAASGVRPFRMLEAFQSLGYEVDTVCGYADERRAAIQAIEARIAAGQAYDFLYSESSTEPTLLTEPHHLPLHPLLDFGFMRRLKAQGIPLGLFYRDIYWRFPGYGQDLPLWKKLGALASYRYDLLQYRRLLDRLYLPSMAMGHHVPWVDQARMRALPPGYVPQQVPPRAPGRPLELLYVGGLGAHYQMHALFEALEHLPDVRLTLCTREAEWRAAAVEYPMPRHGNVRVVHRSGDELLGLYAQSDVCMLFVKPHAYWTFAAPVKQYEYLGLQKPMIASEGTLCGEFVRDADVGWTLPYTAQALTELLRALVQSPSLLVQKQRQLAAVAPAHTWRARAVQVIEDLKGVR